MKSLRSKRQEWLEILGFLERERERGEKVEEWMNEWGGERKEEKVEMAITRSIRSSTIDTGRDIYIQDIYVCVYTGYCYFLCNGGKFMNIHLHHTLCLNEGGEVSSRLIDIQLSGPHLTLLFYRPTLN